MACSVRLILSKRNPKISFSCLNRIFLFNSSVLSGEINHNNTRVLSNYLKTSSRPLKNIDLRYFSSSNLPKYRTANLPSLSPTMETGNIEAWEKKEGDELIEGDTLVQIETDKAIMSWEAPYAGFLAKILYPSHSKNIKVGEPIAIIVKKKEDISSFKDFTLGDITGAIKSEEKPSTSVPKESSPIKTPINEDPKDKTSRVIASPLAKNIASSMGVVLSQITGSGPGNRIIAQDVKNHSSKPQESVPQSTLLTNSSQFIDLPLTNMRLVIAKRLQASKQTIPHYYLSVDVDMDKCLSFRKSFNEKLKGTVKISVNDFITKASSLALMNVPDCNSSFMGDFIRKYHDADISIAVSSEAGLITPILRSVQKKGLIEISNETKLLAEKVRAHKILPHEYQGGSFTISNLGMYGIEFFSAVINPPQSCILAVGSTRKVVVPVGENSTSVKNMMYVTLSCDHRVVDGAVGAQWLQSFKGYIEDPTTMIL